MTEQPLTFADFLPDDRTEDQKRADEFGDRFDMILAEPERRDSWKAWAPMLDARRGLDAVELGLFDYALRRSLAEHLNGPDPDIKRAVAGLIFSEMGWWDPEPAYPVRAQDLGALRDRLRIGHLEPAFQEPPRKHGGARRVVRTRGRRGGSRAFVWLFIGLFLLIMLLG